MKEFVIRIVAATFISKIQNLKTWKDSWYQNQKDTRGKNPSSNLIKQHIYNAAQKRRGQNNTIIATQNNILYQLPASNSISSWGDERRATHPTGGKQAKNPGKVLVGAVT